MKAMNRMFALVVTLMMGVVALPIVAGADMIYIIPDSDRRPLTREELWEYRYDTLLFAFNEIYARHGYKFETGSPCYNWFTQFEWYVPNEDESRTDHHSTYAQCSTVENHNVDLIKDVRREMLELGDFNVNGKGLPEVPDPNVDRPRGFNYVSLQTKQTLPVFTAPSVGAYRMNNGKAAVSTNGAVYAMGYDSGWMLILYEANHAGQYRVGYVDSAVIKGPRPNLDYLFWNPQTVMVVRDTSITDDPALTGNAMTALRAGTEVTYLTTMFNRTAWDYIETTIDGQPARGFIPSGSLSIVIGDDSQP